jgi:hypothetical protein
LPSALEASDLGHEKQEMGVLAIGPAPAVAASLRLLNAAPVPDDATLDIEVHSEKSFLIADVLCKCRIHARQGRSRSPRRQ